MKKRILAALLSAVMVFTMIPFMGVTAYAENTKGPGDEYVSLPITIRDYATDGMLFEWNDMGQTGTSTTSSTYSIYGLNVSDSWFSNYFGLRVYTAGRVPRSSPKFWHCLYCDNNGNITKVYKSGEVKDMTAANNAAFSVWAWVGDSADNSYAYNAISYITDANKSNYKISYSSNSITVETLSGSGTYHHGNTKGYSLLDTTTASHFQGMDIAGTQVTQNGKWNDTPDTLVPSQSTLNSGAVQTLYGCYVRTNLVEPTLGADKKPVYTEATVGYIAQYMQKTLPEKWKNSDGSYNMWYVMGTKLFDNNNNYVGNTGSATRDLAEVFRRCINGGLGSMADTRSKALAEAKDCRTYYDAAYFLLQNLYSDNSGYGQTVKEYSQIHLVKKDDHYVYNSAYDGSVYDVASGAIYNSQTDHVTTREGTTYVRGNLQAENRFDPISGKYFGNNGSKYLEVVDPNQTDITHYYNSTNYNLTLEGHAQFIFYEDDNLFFNFTGDDDVYLYINGVRVLDMGGGHAISKCGIKLNDVKTLCGLKDGQVYDFDFYYMERHGTAANFGIDTNIKIVDPSMLTEKIAYQNGVNVGNYGFVDANEPVRYQFKLTNNGDAKVEELTFKDNDIGVSLSKDAISLNPATAITDLYAGVVGKDGITKASYSAGELTEDGLKALLKNGLEIGDTISIFGFNYTIPDGKWTDNKFTNTVYTTAISKGENASHKTLNGIATCTVQKQEFVYDGIHYYEWMGKGVTATKTELIEAVTKVGVTNPGTNIQLCGSNGKTDSTAVNENAKVTANGITYTGTETGSDTYYYKVGNYGPVAVTVYSYDVADNIYVLDYSLPVELNGADFGLMVNDTLSLAENKYPTTASTLGITYGSATTNYGSFAYGTDKNPTSLKYTMNSFMNGEDSVKIKVQVLEDGADAVTTKTGVVMEETVKVVPANVVYYEDDFPGITYINTDKNGWAHYKTNDSEGNEQSADQNSPYGSDPNYQEDKGTEYTLVLDTSDLNAYQQEVINYLNQQLGLSGGDSSNGSLSALVVKETADVMSFNFRGTGFEIVSRTTQNQYAVVSVKVERKNGDGTYTVVKQFPVITESKGGDLYQVPIISVTGMDRTDYKVTLKAAGSTATKTRILYIDGVRIYQPLDEIDAVNYYNPDEVHAKFYEIKSLIGDGKAIYADISTTGDETQLVTGTTLIEDVNGEQLLGETEDVDQYLKLGPNNELYLCGQSSNGFLAFFLYPDANVEQNARTIQIGAHRKADYDMGPASVDLVYGSTADTILNGTYKYQVDSGTEQYYEIDPANLDYDQTNNRYLLMVGTNDGDFDYSALALTNLKISGYEIGFIEQETKAAAAANAIENSPALTAFKAMQEHYKALAPQEPVEEPSEEPVEEPTINEDLVIESAVLKAAKIVSGKNAMLTAKVSGDAVSVVVLDADGNAVEFKKVASNEKNGIVTFQAVWTVTGNRGDVLNFTVVVYDSNGLRSSNTVPVTVTIK